MFDYATLRQTIDDTFSRKLFFVMGSIRSGTTWLQLVLDGHPEIACRGEGHFTNFLAPDLARAMNRYNKLIDGKNKDIFNEIEGFPLLRREHVLFLLASAIGLQMAQYAEGKSIRVIGEKTPDNIQGLAVLHEMFPEARFIQIIRDGRDAAVSGWFHNLRVSPDWARKTFGTLPRYVENFAQNWVKEVEAGRAFEKKHPAQYLEVRYEDLNHDTAAGVTPLLEFLGVDTGKKAVAQCCAAGDFKTLAGGREPGKENRDSHFRKGTTGDWRNHFDAAATEAFERHAGKLLRRLDYN